jgi:hypothetical protein
MTRSFTVLFRSGGTHNFRWHQALAVFPTFEAADVLRAEIERAGRRAVVQDVALLAAEGLPTTYECACWGCNK